MPNTYHVEELAENSARGPLSIHPNFLNGRSAPIVTIQMKISEFRNRPFAHLAKHMLVVDRGTRIRLLVGAASIAPLLEARKEGTVLQAARCMTAEGADASPVHIRVERKRK